MIIDLADLSTNQVYYTMTQALIPRPIAWVLSDNGEESYNLAPFSYFTAVSSNPPIIMLSIGKKSDGSDKDTAANIESNRHFVVHVPHSEMMEAVNDSAASLPHGESELEKLGLELSEFEGFSLPRLSICRVAMACELYELKQIGELPQTLVFGRVHRLFLDEKVIGSDAKGRTKILADQIDPLARLGASEFQTFGKIAQCARPK